jgi:hypothetical protein
MSRLAVHKRVITCNVWLLSILSFKHNFFMIPETPAAKLIIPWNTFSVDLLFNDPSYCNFNLPLRKFNYANLAGLASQYSEELEQEVYEYTNTGPEEPVFINQYCNPAYPFSGENGFNTNVIEEHIFLAYHFIQTEYQIKLEFNTPARAIYQLLMGSEFHKARSLKPIANMLTRYQAQDKALTVVANFRLINRNLGQHPRYAQIQSIANAWATSRRLAPLHKTRGNAIPHLSPGLKCFFCGDYSDSNEHFLLSEECVVTSSASTVTAFSTTHQSTRALYFLNLTPKNR